MNQSVNVLCWPKVWDTVVGLSCGGLGRRVGPAYELRGKNCRHQHREWSGRNEYRTHLKRHWLNLLSWRGVTEVRSVQPDPLCGPAATLIKANVGLRRKVPGS